MPTPTPVPSSQIVQAVQASQNIIDNAVQQGIVGVLLLIGIAAVLYFATNLLKAYFQRNNRPDNTGVNEAVKAMADGQIRSAEREERLEGERRQERMEWRKQIEERDNKFIEAVNHLGDGYNRMGDILVRQAALYETSIADRNADMNTITAMKADIGQMVNLGSVPLRGLVEESHAIKDDTTVILELLKKIEDRLQRQADCVDITETLKRVEELVKEKEKRTMDIQSIAIVIPDDQPAENGAAEGKAA
jgi:hypothetical protein